MKVIQIHFSRYSNKRNSMCKVKSMKIRGIPRMLGIAALIIPMEEHQMAVFQLQILKIFKVQQVRRFMLLQITIISAIGLLNQLHLSASYYKVIKS